MLVLLSPMADEREASGRQPVVTEITIVQFTEKANSNKEVALVDTVATAKFDRQIVVAQTPGQPPQVCCVLD